MVASCAQRAAAALPPLQSTRLLDRVRERIRGLHYSRRTELSYLHWIKGFIRFHGIRNPAEMGGPEVEAYLTWLADARGVSASTHRQALSALIFLYTKVLQADSTFKPPALAVFAGEVCLNFRPAPSGSAFRHCPPNPRLTPLTAPATAVLPRPPALCRAASSGAN